MARNKSGLDTYRQLLEQRRDEAGRALAAQQQVLQQEQARLASLEHFRGEYLAGLRDHDGGWVSAAELQRSQHYLATLDRAIGQQTGRIRGCEGAVQQQQAGLAEARKQELSVTTLLNGRARAAADRAAKANQQQADELASQAYQRKRREQAEPENLD